MIPAARVANTLPMPPPMELLSQQTRCTEWLGLWIRKGFFFLHVSRSLFSYLLDSVLHNRSWALGKLVIYNKTEGDRGTL